MLISSSMILFPFMYRLTELNHNIDFFDSAGLL